MSKLQSEKAKKSWADPAVRKRRIKALRLANGKPRTAAHRRKLGLAHVGTKASRKTRSQMSTSHKKRFANLVAGACRMCGSAGHTYEQHQQRVCEARRKSKKWRQTVADANRLAKLGKKASRDTRKKMSATHLVVQNSPEQLALRKTHGESAKNITVEYVAWHSMITRCEDPNFIGWHRYGGRGISVCKRWRKSYENFLKDVGRKPSPDHSLDRYPDPDGNYEPGNVRWATGKQQRWNRGV